MRKPSARGRRDGTLTGGNLTLTGSASLAGGTVNGSQSLMTNGTTTVSGVTIGGTVVWDNTNTVIQSGGAVTIGGQTGARPNSTMRRPEFTTLSTTAGSRAAVRRRRPS